jgi:hypothetical protein
MVESAFINRAWMKETGLSAMYICCNLERC